MKKLNKEERRKLQEARAEKTLRFLERFFGAIEFIFKGFFLPFVFYGAYLIWTYPKAELEQMYFGIFAYLSDYILFIVVALFAAAQVTRPGESILGGRKEDEFKKTSSRRRRE